ncbi:LysR family transcriptional regulator [Streptococcus criceti]|uniref:Transcriptional regulator, LysR family n=1 Tax=Streptococcus criceti HS-6 TaxID=873449 RepID=G5JNW7_STRCG|nr:LysR family transcriptional regulator [Streptococcus criceti]EHI73586.1 transcriptional regulator, LysR family [Streptococcus criceti HS-6]SUN43379.1 LysR family transcriptional regulator [Streptococcus criceti]
MDIRVLQYFVSIAEEKSISKAAQKRHITQPTLSRQMKDLEEELGTQLLHRGSREISLTEDGHYLYNRALEILSLVDKTTNNLVDKGPISGPIAIGAAEGRSIKTVIDQAKAFQEEFPNTRLDVTSGNADDIIEKINAGILDLGIVAREVNHEHFKSMALPSQEAWGVLLPKDHPLASQKSLQLKDLEPYPLIITNQKEGRNLFLERVGKKAKLAATFNLVYNASLMVESGMGVAITWPNLINTDSPTGPLTFIPLTDDLPDINLHLIWKRNSQQSRVVQSFLKFLKENL